MRSFERAPIAVQLKRIGDATEKLHVACKLYHFRAFRLFKGLIKPLACLTILSQSYQNSQRLTHIIHNWGHVRVLCRLPTAELQRPMSSRGTLWTFCSAFARPMLKIRSQSRGSATERLHQRQRLPQCPQFEKPTCMTQHWPLCSLKDLPRCHMRLAHAVNRNGVCSVCTVCISFQRGVQEVLASRIKRSDLNPRCVKM